MSGKTCISKCLSLRFGSNGPKSHWFGYYNYSPVSADGTKMLSQEVDFDGRDIRPEDTADVGWYDLTDGAWHKIATTRAINWQQGAMLQWLGPDFNSRVIFNDVEGEHFCARIYDVTTGKLEKTIPFAIYGVSPDGKFSITLQFERCAWVRAYHYEPLKNKEWNVPVPEGDGIFRVDLESGDVRRIIAIADVVKMLNSSDCDGSEWHWFEHIMLNPSGTRFAFYHRYGHGYEFTTKAYTANVDGSDIKPVPTDPRCTYSHLGWKNDREFAIYNYAKTAIFKGYKNARSAKKKTLKTVVVAFIRRIVRALIPAKVRVKALGSSYYTLVEDGVRILEHLNKCSIAKYGDGHPSFTRDGEWMLTDTYEQADSTRVLLLYNLKTHRTMELGRFHSPFNSCGYRSDLHPRFSRDERSVIIDSAHSGQHQIYVYEISWEEVR